MVSTGNNQFAFVRDHLADEVSSPKKFLNETKKIFYFIFYYVWYNENTYSPPNSLAEWYYFIKL